MNFSVHWDECKVKICNFSMNKNIYSSTPEVKWSMPTLNLFLDSSMNNFTTHLEKLLKNAISA